VPLFLFIKYAIQTDPAALAGTLPSFDTGAILRATRGWHYRHGRFYDVAHWKSRVLDHVGAFDIQLIEYTDVTAVDASRFLRFAVVFTRRWRAWRYSLRRRRAGAHFLLRSSLPSDSAGLFRGFQLPLVPPPPG
jgi:hypothetical protein